MDRTKRDEYVEYVRARMPRLHRTAWLICGDPHLADDAVQATLAVLYSRWRHVSTVENLDGFVHRILTRRIVDERRSRWSRVLLRASPPEPPDRVTAPGQPGEYDHVVDALRALPNGQRAALVLRYFADLSVQDTARALGCSEGNVKSQCSRGLSTLRDALTASGTEPGSDRPRTTTMRLTT
ncbi:SigE family RNA polymerase sigma factor [Virgisporangium ochraceum]|uniref:RNA polymerase sigma24 factor n=1 Tax=Virgisporangium ochraceum TaxID=65505 RepID=A0A8J4EHT1_9ACTN|nr:SigE family RNA polymerase sigma factor [Virgisporangium ochraceum]GIJ75058.1 RNA polymerase sigma24 factor [Virgisporangium ochraceum]